MVRTKDDFWQYAEQHGSRFKCKFCNRDFSGGVSRLEFHLSGIKGQDVDICTQVMDEVQGKAYLHLMGKSKKLKSGTSESSDSIESRMGSSPFTSKEFASKFASNFQMLQSIIDVEDELRLLVASAEWRGLEYSKKSLGKHITEIIQNAEFWARGRRYYKY
ncbi:hypothetical protein Dimus_003915 [Dionaea muscipula]